MSMFFREVVGRTNFFFQFFFAEEVGKREKKKEMINDKIALVRLTCKDLSIDSLNYKNNKK